MSDRRPASRPPPPSPSRRTFLGAALGVSVGVALTAVGCSAREPAASDARDGEAPDAAPSSDASSTAPAPTTPSSSTGGPAAFIARSPRPDPQVALTFHTNGDLGLARQLLEIVDARRIPITCFVVGNWLEANPSWGPKLRDAGHELANHTFTHPDFTALTPSAMATEITRCRDVLRRAGGDGGRFFRPSGTDDGTADPGPAIERAAGLAGYPIVAGFDVDPFDYRDPGADAVTSRTLDAVRGGSIVSLHFGHVGTIKALPAILDGLSARGLEPVTLSRLLG